MNKNLVKKTTNQKLKEESKSNGFLLVNTLKLFMKNNQFRF